jgi:hypothetical protein
VAGKRILLVEGKNDRHVVYALLDRRGIPPVFEVDDKKGDGQLLDFLNTWLKGSDVERLAVILDADEGGVGRRWQQLTDRLSGIPGIEIPRQPDENGTLIAIPDGPLLGVWLMPDNRLPGMLEDFIAFLVPSDDELLPRVDGFLDGIPALEKRFSEAHRPKARIHCWLSLQQEPGKPLGQAITARYLDATCQFADPFVNWLQRALVD